MKKHIYIATLFVASSLFGQTFEEFRAQALENSPYLRANALVIEQAQQLSEITMRYANPTLGLEASRFKQDLSGVKDNGYRVELTQPIRLWGVSGARDELAQAQQKRAKASFSLKRAEFLKKLSEQYVVYKQLVSMQKLAQQEQEIAKTIANISYERFKNGTIAKVKYIQASLDLKRVQNRVNELEVAKTNAYYTLLALAGLKQEVKLQTDYTFRLQEGSKTAPELAYIDAQAQEAAAQAQLNSNKIEWIDARVEYEKEPEQSILRGGVNIPLAVFNTSVNGGVKFSSFFVRSITKSNLKRLCPLRTF